MNKIYKVVWSKVKNCYVVVSEIAKNVITGSVKSAKVGVMPVAKGMAMGVLAAFMMSGSALAYEHTQLEDNYDSTVTLQIPKLTGGYYSVDVPMESIANALNSINGTLNAIGQSVDDLDDNITVVSGTSTTVNTNLTVSGTVTANDFIVGEGATAVSFNTIAGQVGTNTSAISGLNTTVNNHDIDIENLSVAVSYKASRTELNELSGTVTDLSNTVAGKANQSDLEALSGTVGGHTTAIGQLNTTVNEHTSQIENLSEAFSYKASRTELNALSGTVTDLSSTVAGKANQSDLEALSGTVGGHTTAIGQLNTTVNEHTSQIENISEAFSYKANITEVAATYATKTALNDGLALKANQSDLVALDGKVGGHETAISQLQTDKANKATTLAGYGITNAYTIDQVNAAIETATTGFLTDANLTALQNKTQNIVLGTNGTVEGKTVIAGDVEVEGNVQAATFNGIDLNKALSVLGIGANTTYWTAEDNENPNETKNLSGTLIKNSTGELRISGGEFIKYEKNTSSNVTDGMILGAVGATNFSKVIIENSKFAENKNLGSGKHHAVVKIYSPAQISDSYFMDNETTTMGGALYLGNNTFDITDSVFSGNQAGQGAAIQGNTAIINLSGNTFTDNTATKDSDTSGEDCGGAICVQSGKVNFEDINTFNENKALKGNGGAFANYYGSPYSAEMNFKEGSITYFNNNYANKNGGAIWNKETINVDGTVIFEGNKAGVEFDENGDVVANTGRKNDIYNEATININQSGIVNLDGGIEGTGYININGGTLNGKVTGNSVAMVDGTWDLAGKSEVSALSGNGTLKVDLTKEELEQVKVQSDAADLSEIIVDHSGVLGVDVEQGVAKYYQSVIGSDNQSLIKNHEIGNIFLQAAVKTNNGEYVSTTIKPGKAFVIDSESVTVNGNLSAGSITVDGVGLDTTVTYLSTAIENEKTRAEGVEAGLQAGIDANTGEITRVESEYKAADAEIRKEIETEIAGVTSAYESADADLKDGYVAADAELQAGIDANAGAIETLEGRVETAEGKITTLEGKVESAQGDITTLKDQMTEAQGAIDTLEGKVETAEANANKYADGVAKTAEVNAKTYADGIVSDLANGAVADNTKAIKGLGDRVETAEGEIDTLQTTVGEHAQAIANNAEAISGFEQRLGKMNGKINKVGAGAAALAALHPLEYDPDDKLTFSAGVGNYNGENAAALGAFYRPDEKLMFSLGGTMGNGENMVNLGVSIGLDGAKGAPKLSRKELVEKVSAMAAENQAIKAENEALENRIEKLEALVAELAAKK